MHIVLLKIHLEIFLWFVYCAYRTKEYIYSYVVVFFIIHAMTIYSFWSFFSTQIFIINIFLSFPLLTQFRGPWMRLIDLTAQQWRRKKIWKSKWSFLVRLKVYFLFNQLNFLEILSYIIMQTIGKLFAFSK